MDTNVLPASTPATNDVHTEAIAWFMERQDNGLESMSLTDALTTMRECFHSEKFFRLFMDMLVDTVRSGGTTPEQSMNIVNDFYGPDAGRAWSRIMQSFGW